MTAWRAVAMAIVSLMALLAVDALAAPPHVVEISEPTFDAAPLNPADVHMVARFADGDEDDHVCSDWEIWTDEPSEPVWQAHCIKGPERVHIHLGDGDFVNAYAGRSDLKFDTGYTLRVRFFDSGDEWSEWAERPFETKSPGEEGNDTPVPWEARPGYEVEEVATGFQLPVNIAMVPDPGPHPSSPLFYVAELYGNIKVVRRDGVINDYATELLNFNPTGNFPGSGETGLAGLAVDPASGDLFATLIYEDEGSLEDPKPHYPEVIRLHSDEHGLAATEVTTVLDMAGEAQGPSHQVSHVEILPGEKLMVHIGDGFDDPTAARDTESFRGKILRMDFDGNPLPDNPLYDAGDGITAKDYIWAYGFRNPFGGAYRLSDSTYFEVENGPSVDRLARVLPGVDYRWEGSNEDMAFGASYNWPLPHAPVNIDFVEPGVFGGSGFPAASMGHAFVTESGPTYANGPQGIGKQVVEFDLASDGTSLEGPTTLVKYTGTGRATAVGLAAGEGGLYFTDLYKDHDYTTPIDAGANVLRISYCGDDTCPVDAGEETALPDSTIDERPVIRFFHLRRKRFFAGRRNALVYVLSEPCQVRIRIHALDAGWKTVLRASGRKGRNRRVFAARLRRHRLSPGRYLATIVARDRSGKVAKRRRVGFRVLPSVSRHRRHARSRAAFAAESPGRR